ncbi:MAG: restriction endonuclease PLD domain-containing protein [bacterium]
MLAKNLFNDVLVKPLKEGSDKLCIVSGYATAAMAFHHLQEGHKLQHKFDVELLVGMCPKDGLSLSNHRGFQQLERVDYKGIFRCSYIYKAPAVHSKVYIWLRRNLPVSAFLGSANYTQNAFGKAQREAMAPCDAICAYDYFQKFNSDSVFCTAPEVEELIPIYDDKSYFNKRLPTTLSAREKASQDLTGLSSVEVSLLDRSGMLPSRSGLNWGQRPEVRREPNQAYIRLPSTVYMTDFFPKRGVTFTVLTDDEKVLICTRAQDNGKAIHTPQNNSLIGEYFRSRLSLPSGALVKKEDLVRYGSTTLRFYKIDEETYFLDFSPIL